MEKIKQYRGFQNAWWIVLITFTASLLSGALAVLGERWFPVKEMTFWLMLVSEAALAIPAALALIWAKAMTPYYSMKDIMGLHAFDPRILLILIALPICGQSYFTLAAWPANALLSGLFGDAQQMEQMSPGTLGQTAALFGALCILAPIFEELIFRGGIIHMLDRYGNVFAVLVSGAMFAMVHFNPSFIVIYFALGALLGLVRYVTGSVIPCMIIHMANNFVGFLQLVFLREFTKLAAAAPAPLIAEEVVLAIAFPLLLLWMLKILGVRVNFTKAYARPRFSVGALIFALIFSAACWFSAINDGAMGSLRYMRDAYESARDREYGGSTAPFHSTPYYGGGEDTQPYGYDDSLEEFFENFFGEYGGADYGSDW